MCNHCLPNWRAGGLAVAHNGNLTNGLTLRRELVSQGAICQSTSDTEVILHLVARSQKPRIVERYIDALRALEGAYSLVALTNKKLIGARDPLGIGRSCSANSTAPIFSARRPARSTSSVRVSCARSKMAKWS